MVELEFEEGGWEQWIEKITYNPATNELAVEGVFDSCAGWGASVAPTPAQRFKLALALLSGIENWEETHG